MATTPAARLERITRHAREGYRLTRDDLARRRRAAAWIVAHPSRCRAIDELWLETLEGRGPLAHWLATGLPPESWEHASLSLHSILASHPFPDLPQWSTPKTSNPS